MKLEIITTMRKFAFILLLFAAIGLVFVRCNNHSVDDRIDIAYAAYSEKDMVLAQQELNQMIERDSLKDCSCNDLCRLSILLMKLSEQGYEENIAPAVRCYYRSFEIDADSATAFFSQLPVEDAPYVTILSALSVSLDPDQEIRLQEFEVNENDIDLLMLNNDGDA